MLNHILIKDLAIVTAVELDLATGMTALTGETGAGKSILIDALGLALGDKADATLIRADCDRAEITASFELPERSQAHAWLRENALEEEGACIMRRLLVRNGRSRAFVNGRPVALQQLRELGEVLVDIHGQHDHQSLLRVKQQGALLDAYGQHAPLVGEVAALYRRYRNAASRLEQLRRASSDRAARLDLLRYQEDELSALDLAAEELTGLDEEQKRLRNIDRLRESCAALLHRLYDADRSVQGELSAAGSELGDLAALDERLNDPRELLESALIQLQEAASSLRDYADGLELDPGRLRQVEDRLEQIHDLARKYRVRPEQLPETLEALRTELEQLAAADFEVEHLTEEVAALHADYLDQARTLSARRATAGERLGATVTESMQTLGMAGGRFQAHIRIVEDDQAGSNGLDRVEFLVSANPGQPLKPLSKVASGGELSRISLAIQVATAECGRIPTLVFDEVDVGIGGGVAEIVGRLLRQLGAARQVLCVTHLPQVAAQAHHHLQVRKFARDSQTFTAISSLTPEQRIEEIARMLGGVAITATTLDHAREMIARSHP